MNAPDPAPTAGASPALAAFLRGVGRRVLLFVDVLAGPAGEAAVPAMLPEFIRQAASRPMAQWPGRFWRLVLALPVLHTDPAPGRRAILPEALARLDAGPRTVVLLWLVAGLDEEGAAAALGVASPTWRLAMERAAPRDTGGRVDEATWQSWSEALRESLREVPPAQLAWWDHQCGKAVLRAGTTPSSAPETTRPHWLLPLLWSGVVLCALALAASFFWQPAGDSAEPTDPGVVHVSRTPLPAAATPAASFDADFALRSHRDLELLAGGDEGLLRDLDFHAWHAAQLGSAPVEQLQPIDPAALRPVAMPERIAAWQAMPARERTELRERWEAWQQMPAPQRSAVLDAAATFDALAPDAQRALRLEFAKLSDADRRGWLLGPRLGLAWPRLQPLLMQVPASEREPLLQALHALSPLQLDDLATLAQRTPPQDRDALRRELLSTAASNRSAWLRERLRR